MTVPVTVNWDIVWLHLEDKVAAMSESLLSSEGRAVVIKRGVITLVPPVSVKGVEIILPVEVVAVGLEVVSVSLNVVIDAVPWHVICVEPVSP